MQHKYEITFETTDSTYHVLRVLGETISNKFGDNHIVALHKDPMPTEPGVYTIADNDRDLFDRRLMILSSNGLWRLPSDKQENSFDEDARCRALVENYGWTLTKLVMEK